MISLPGRLPPALVPPVWDALEVPVCALNIPSILPMMEMDTRLWCGARSSRAAIGNETREMNEPQVTRISGPDAASWSSYQAASGRSDAARPAPAPREPVPVEKSRPTTTGTPSEPEERPAASDSGTEATFPTSYARFSINAETQKLSIKIVDSRTDEVIREIPPEQVQRIAEDLQSLARRASVGKRPAGADGAKNVAGGGVDRYV